MNYNRTVLGGHLTRDVELRYTPKGTAVANFGLAVNRKGSAGNEEVAWIDCTAWQKTAELIKNHFQKGSPILVEGRLKTESWDDKQTGRKNSKLIVVVEQFTFCGGGNTGSDIPQKPAAATSAPKSDEKPPDDDVPF